MKLGILIIGSLLWSDHRSKTKPDNIRKDWRSNHLDTQNAIKVYLPIRYGRKSEGQIYTMVFSTRLEKTNNYGIGLLVPVKSNPKNYEGLIKEALELAKAEGMGKIDNPRLFASWGASIGVKIKDGKDELLKKWSEKFRQDGGGKDTLDYRVNRERRSIGENGRLQIMWPQVIDYRDKSKFDEIDVIIGTSTKPMYDTKVKTEIFKYPNLEEIKDSIVKDNERNYFLNNLKNGILTYQDMRLLQKLKSI